MALTSLNRISVPTTNGTSGTALLMPKLKYRFRVILQSFGVEASTELTKQVSDVTRPTVTFEEMTIEVYNSKVKLAGKPSWGDITLNLRDDANGQVQKFVGQQVQKQFDFMEQASARSGVDYKFQMIIEMLDGGNGGNVELNVLEKWELYGCFVSEVNYGDANYGENSPMTVALTIKYDNAVQFAGANGAGPERGIGANVAGQILQGIGEGQTATG
jgi:hypothetical protein